MGRNYLSTKGVESLAGMGSPKRAEASAILSSTLLTISPRYIPDIVFSNICIVRKLNICRIGGFESEPEPVRTSEK